MKTILFYGDSITDARHLKENDDNFAGHGYATMVKGLLGAECPGEYTFLNRGVAGDRVRDLFCRVRRDVLNLKPDYMSILIGVNDVWHELNHQNGNSEARFEQIYGYLLDEILHISDMDEDSEETLEYLYSDGCISEEKCGQVAEHLYWENKTITDAELKDNTKAWSMVTLRQDKELSVSYGTVNSSRNRIQSLLTGKEEVEKGDLLYLLWYTFNLAWGDTEATEPGVIYDRIFDLKDAAAALLENALLPPFYPPHLMEQSMLLSIIYAGKTGTDPSVVYGAVQQSLRSTRNSAKKSGKHSLQEQIEIITHYRNPESPMTLKQCSLLYGISEQTISRWQKELLEKGLV